MTRANRVAGFSLIEVIVVIGIMTLLLALLMPALQMARESARVTLCKAQQRQIHLGVTAYANDNHGVLPSARAWVIYGWWDINNVINGQLWPYMNNDRDAYTCPTFLQIYRQVPGNENIDAAYNYSINEYILQEPESWQGHRIHRELELSSPSKVLLNTEENPWVPTVIDGKTWAAFPINNGAFGVGAWGNDNSVVDGIATYHLSRNPLAGWGNVTFFDGHTNLHRIFESKELATPDEFR